MVWCGEGGIALAGSGRGWLAWVAVGWGVVFAASLAEFVVDGVFVDGLGLWRRGACWMM